MNNFRATALLAVAVLSGGLSALTSAQGSAAATPVAFTAALARAGIPQQAVGVVVLPLDAGPLRMRLNANQPLNPASTMKLLTTYAGLSALGPAYTWKTEVLARGTRRDDLLEGDLVLRGSGDPGMVIERFWLLLQRLRALGLREIRGDLLLDRSAYAAVPFDPEAFDGAETRAYNAGPDPLLINFNAVSFELAPDPGAGLARVSVTPAIVRNATMTVSAATGACGDWRALLKADLSNPLQPAFRGRYPLACGSRTLHALAPDPNEYVSRVFRLLWEQAGGVWRGGVRSAAVGPADASLFSFESRPLAEVVRDINKFSNNVMTRQLFLTLAQLDTRQPASAPRAAQALASWLAGRGIVARELVLENGAGLSRIERISAATMAAVLADAYASPQMPELMASLPVVGVDGTMRARRAAAGSAHIKTGMLQGVRAIAGYVRAESGRRYVIVAIVNHPNAGAANPANDALLEWIYREG